MGRILTRTTWRTRSHRSPFYRPRWPLVLNLDSPQAEALVVAYPFVPRGGGVLRDLGPNRFHGTLTNMNPDVDWVPSIHGEHALDFDGSDDHIILTTLGDLGSNLADGVTGSFWIKTTDTSQGWVFGTRNPSDGVRLDMRINTDPVTAANVTGEIQLFSQDEDTVQLFGGVNSDTGITDGFWHNIVFTIHFSTNTIQVFVDGVSQAIVYDLQNTPSNFVNWTRNQFIGGFNDGGAPLTPLTGQLESFQFNNTILPEPTLKSFFYLPTRWGLYYELGRVFYSVPAAAAVGNPWHVYAQQ